MVMKLKDVSNFAQLLNHFQFALKITQVLITYVFKYKNVINEIFIFILNTSMIILKINEVKKTIQQ